MAACFYFIKERFMKMSDVFNLPAKQNESRHFGNVVYTTPDDKVILSADSCELAKYTVHAINNHDRMIDEIAELRGALLRKSSHATNLEHEISQLCTEKAELIHALLELSEWKPIESYENALYEAKELLAKHK